MKQKLFLLLALPFCWASTWAEDVTISSAAELVAFASRVNAGETSLNATLTANIDLTGQTWTPIGNNTNKYAGTFDGGGFTISNFEYTATSDYNGLFGYISNATIKNFSISGTLTSDGYTKNGVVGCATGTSKVTGIHSSMAINVSNFKAHTGGIVGGDNGATSDKIVVDGCEFSGTLTHSGTGDCQAGIMGYTGYSTIRNCIFSGTINGETSRYAGILGYCKQPSFGGVQNCLSIGKITVSSDSSNKGSIIGTWNGNETSNVKNNYYCLKEGSNITRAIGGNTANCEAPHAVTAEELASGKVCYLLNTNGTNWFQTIDTDNNPVPFSTSKRVYKTLADTYVNIDGPVQIGDADDLVNFAVNINHGGTDWDAELTADIDMNGADVSHFPIGAQATGNRYIGTFDGQGHKISNLQLINPSASNYGMFVTGDGVVLKNFWLDNTCAIEGTQYVGLIGRHDSGAATFEGLGNCANVTGSSTRNGGLIGGAWGTVDDVKKTMTIKNCWTKGNVSASGSAGAICGWFNNINVVITNCWTVAEVTGATSDSKYMYDNGAGASFTITNCYSKNGSQPNYTTFTDEQLANGELCYLLNGSIGGGTDWYQTLPSTDAFPYPYSTHEQVYVNGTVCPDTGTPQGTYSYGNTEGTTVGDHDPVDGFCSYCGAFIEDGLTPNTDGYYEIANSTHLKWLAAKVNSGDMTVNAILTDDIDMSNLATWRAIGDWGATPNGTACFKGHFNGQGFTIKNFNIKSSHNYYGIFGVISGALVENFSINGTITSSVANAGVIGYARDATPTIRNIHSSLNINNTRVGSKIGGILGNSNNGTVVVDRCTYSGTLDGKDAENNGNYGGIVGYVNNNGNAHLGVTNCLFDGKLINTAETPGNCTFGGIVGYVGDSPDVTITNCLSVGMLQSAVTGQFYGAVKHNTCSIINSFYQGDNINGSSSTVTPTTQEATLVDDTKLASGEVAYKLGYAWYQTIETDTYPTLSNASEKVLYVGEAGYSTMYDAANGWKLVGDAKAYIGTINGSALHLDEIADIPAGTAVVISGTYYNKVSTTANASTDGNVLLGSDGSVTGNGSTIFALSNKANGVGFYPVGDGVKIPAGKAYLEYTNTGGGAVKGFTFVFDDDATGIEDLKDSKDLKDSNVIYNIAGQRLDNSQFTIHNSQLKRGIYIVNGEKVLK